MASKWYKCDLQVATPAWRMSLPKDRSYNFGKPDDREAFADLYMDHLKRRGIEVIALADHHTATWLSDMKDAGARAGITVFPGVEVTTGTGSDGAHLILIGDLSKTEQDIEILLAKACGFDEPEHPKFNPALKRQPAPAPRSIGDILDDLPEGWLAIAPHVLGDNGLASLKTVGDTLRWKALHHNRLSAVDVGHFNDDEGAGSKRRGFNQRFRARDLDNLPCLKRLAFIRTSDAYRVEDLGSHFSWIRMNEPSLEGLRQAFLDYEARIICDWDDRLSDWPDPNHVDHSWVESVTLGGRLGNSVSPISVTFAPRLNVIIGGRGSGKSTIVAALRQLYGTTDGLPEALRAETEDFVERVFDSAELAAAHHLEISGEQQSARWTREDGPTTDRGVTTKTAFPIRLFGQKELYERIKSVPSDPYVASRNLLGLIDEAVEAAGDGSRHQFTEGRAALEDRCERLVRERQRVQTALGRKDELEARAVELSRQIAVLDNADFKARREHNEGILRERAELESIATNLNQTISDIRQHAEGLLSQSSQASELDARSSTRAPHLRRLDDVRAQLLNDLLTATGQAETGAKAAEAARQEGPWADEVRQAADDEAAYQSELTEAGVDPAKYLGLREELSTVERGLVDLEGQQKRLAPLKEDEASAWNALATFYDGRRRRRTHLVDDVHKKSGSLRFDLAAHGDWAGWERAARDLLNLRVDGFVADVRAVAKWLWSGSTDNLKARLLTWRHALIDSQSAAYWLLENELPDVRKAWWQKLRKLDGTLRLRLSMLTADDVITMRFLKSGGRADRVEDWQDVSHGSPGQRSAAMLSFVLHQGTEPLVIDQPEDDLDTALISELIVTELRKSRWERQVIIVTHNANIPVLSDAEQIVVLEAHEGSLRVKESDGQPHIGPIEVMKVRHEIQNVLEGGVAAFITRERRYDNELSTYRRDLAAAERPRDPARSSHDEVVPMRPEDRDQRS
jgi:energy-coupling factor transporter ATP-binding protein EcfA2